MRSTWRISEVSWSKRVKVCQFSWICLKWHSLLTKLPISQGCENFVNFPFATFALVIWLPWRHIVQERARLGGDFIATIWWCVKTALAWKKSQIPQISTHGQGFSILWWCIQRGRGWHTNQRYWREGYWWYYSRNIGAFNRETCVIFRK